MAYSIAFTLFMLPHAFITVSIMTALFPRFSAAAAAGDRDGLRRDFRTGLAMPLVANVPIMVAVIVLANPIVALLNPGIDTRSVEVSASVLIIMILGLVPFGLDLLCYRMFFALEDGKPTVVMQVLLTAISALAGARDVLRQPGVGHRHHGDGPDRRQRRQLRGRASSCSGGAPGPSG